MDIPAIKDFTLKGDDKPQKIPTGIYGPLPPGTFALLTGRSSLNAKGVTIHLGIIDADYTGEIQILMSSIVDIKFHSGERIAQLILLPYIPIGESKIMRQGGFGSTNDKNVFWSTQITHMQPLIKIKLNGKDIIVLIDTGSDITIIKTSDWPHKIPYDIIPCQIKGVAKTPVQSIGLATQFVTLISQDGQVAVIKPYVLDVPLNILGRDVLEQWGAHIEF